MIPDASISDQLPEDEPQAAPDACPAAVSIMDLERPPEDDPNELLKYRFLCRGAGCFWSARPA